MNLKSLALFLTLSAAATGAHAGTDRQGFIIGLGVGYGSQGVEGDNYDDSFGGLGTSFMIGGGATNQFTIYYINDVQFFTLDDGSGTGTNGDGDLWAAGLTGVGGTFYFSPETPSAYLGVAFGLTSMFDMEDSLVSSYQGNGTMFTAGFEFARHLSFELNLIRGSAENEDDSTDEVDLAATRVLFKWIWY
jgi:hypothetical protein